MKLTPLRSFVADNPQMTRSLWSLMREAFEVSATRTQGDLTDDDITAALEAPDSFWRVVSLPESAYAPVIGIVGLQKFSPVDGTGEIAVAVFPEHRGKAWGAKLSLAMREWAVSMLNLRKLTMFVVAGSRGEAIAQELGDTLEGRLRAAKFHEGGYVDVVIYSWLREA